MKVESVYKENVLYYKIFPSYPFSFLFFRSNNIFCTQLQLSGWGSNSTCQIYIWANKHMSELCKSELNKLVLNSFQNYTIKGEQLRYEVTNLEDNASKNGKILAKLRHNLWLYLQVSWWSCGNCPWQPSSPFTFILEDLAQFIKCILK